MVLLFVKGLDARRGTGVKGWQGWGADALALSAWLFRSSNKGACVFRVFYP